MARILTLLILLSAICSFQSCLKCKGDGKNSGVIVGPAPDVFCGYGFGGHTVVTSQQQLDSINNGPCNSKDSVDFNTYTILGNEGVGSCRSNFDRDVKIDYANAKYVYTTTENSCFCWNKKAAVFSNLVLVPKLPPGYIVEFVERGE